MYLTTLDYLSAHLDVSDGKMKVKAITDRRIVIMAKYMLMWASLANAFLSELPSSFDSSPSVWAYYSYDDPAARVLPGSFNRSIFDAPCESETSDTKLSEAYDALLSRVRPASNMGAQE